MWRNGEVFILWIERRFDRRLRLDQESLPMIGHRRIRLDGCLDHRGRIDGRKVDWSRATL